MYIRLVVSMLLLVIGSSAHAYDQLAPRAVDLSGRWAVNAKLSDDVDAQLLQRLEKQLERERRWREEAAEQEGTSTPAQRESLSPAQTGRVLEQLRRVLELYTLVEITQSAAGAQLELKGDGNQRRFTAGGRSQISMPEGQLADAEVGWDGEEFVIDRKVRRGPHVVERYRLLKKTGQLQAIISWRGGDELLSGIKVKRVFDRNEAAPAPPNPELGPVR